MAQGPGWVPHLLTFQEQGLQRDDPPETTPMYTPDQKAYKCYWHKGTPLYAQTGIHVHLVHHLSVPGRLGVYSKKKCFSIALGHTLVVLEMH